MLQHRRNLDLGDALKILTQVQGAVLACFFFTSAVYAVAIPILLVSSTVSWVVAVGGAAFTAVSAWIGEGVTGAILACAFIGGLMLKRDWMAADMGSHVFIKPVNEVVLQDAVFLMEHHFDLVSWDKPAGEMVTAWNTSDVEGENVLHGFYPRCEGFQGNKVVDTEGHLFPLDYWTPNGTAAIQLPKAGAVEAQWMMEISEDDVWDCRDRYDELPPEVPRPTPKVLSEDQLLDIQKAKERKLLKECDAETWKKYVRGELAINKNETSDSGHLKIQCERATAVTSYFSVLPADTASISKYATDGAELLVQHFQADNMEPREQARALHTAMSSILNRHHEEKRWLARLTRRGPTSADADAVMNAMIDAVVDAADARDKKWMQMLAIGAISRTVRESFQAKRASMAEYKAMDMVFGRFA